MSANTKSEKTTFNAVIMALHHYPGRLSCRLGLSTSPSLERVLAKMAIRHDENAVEVFHADFASLPPNSSRSVLKLGPRLYACLGKRFSRHSPCRRNCTRAFHGALRDDLRLLTGGIANKQPLHNALSLDWGF